MLITVQKRFPFSLASRYRPLANSDRRPGPASKLVAATLEAPECERMAPDLALQQLESAAPKSYSGEQAIGTVLNHSGLRSSVAVPELLHGFQINCLDVLGEFLNRELPLNSTPCGSSKFLR